MEQREKQVLIVTNSISEEEIHQIKDALQQEDYLIKPHLVHIIPSLPTCYFNIPSMGMLVEKSYDEAREILAHIGRVLAVAKKDQWLISGKIRTEVLRLANKLDSHFILAGAKQIQELQHSLFFNHVHQHKMIKQINQLR